MTEFNLQFKQKMTLGEFEQRLVEDHGQETLSKRRHREDGTPMTLYYKNGKHVGTHCKGHGWAFKWAYA